MEFKKSAEASCFNEKMTESKRLNIQACEEGVHAELPGYVPGHQRAAL